MCCKKFLRYRYMRCRYIRSPTRCIVKKLESGRGEKFRSRGRAVGAYAKNSLVCFGPRTGGNFCVIYSHPLPLWSPRTESDLAGPIYHAASHGRNSPFPQFCSSLYVIPIRAHLRLDRPCRRLKRKSTVLVVGLVGGGSASISFLGLFLMEAWKGLRHHHPFDSTLVSNIERTRRTTDAQHPACLNRNWVRIFFLSDHRISSGVLFKIAQ
jgi:hypothetical protein